jgi:hypothetical protein
MSGEYSVESSPGLIQSSHGTSTPSVASRTISLLTATGFVDLVRQPAYFQRSYAQTALDLDENAFATGSDSSKSKSFSSLSSSTASDEEVFTNVGICLTTIEYPTNGDLGRSLHLP